MSNTVYKIKIERSNEDGRWLCLTIKYEVSNRESNQRTRIREYNDGNRNIDDAITTVMDRFIKTFSSTYLQSINLDKFKCDMVQGFQQMQEINLYRTKKVLFFGPEKQLESHFSCKMNENEYSVIQASIENEVAQSEVQQKLSIVDKDSEVMKFYEDNKCSVCLSNYSEILDDNLHIVIPSCGHPLCCECADNISKSRKKECPRCKKKHYFLCD